MTYLMDNINAAVVQLDGEDIREIEAIVYPGSVKGERYTQEGMKGVNC